MKQKRFLVWLLLTACAVALGVWAEEDGSSSTAARRQAYRARMAEMRAAVQAQGGMFSVGDNPALQVPLQDLFSFSAANLPADTWRNESSDSGISIRLPAYYIGYYTPVVNQSLGNTSWAEVTVEAFESAIKKFDGVTVALSTQFLIACNPWGWGCDGGAWAHSMHVSPGAVLASCYPTSSCDAPCIDTCPHPYLLRGWAYVGSATGVPNTAAIKQAIYTYGCVSAAVCVDSYFQAYTGGTYNHNATGRPNHCVTLVGWDDARGAWRLKNTWGTGWGEGGFMWIRYGCSSVGYSANYVIY